MNYKEFSTKKTDLIPEYQLIKINWRKQVRLRFSSRHLKSVSLNISYISVMYNIRLVFIPIFFGMIACRHENSRIIDGIFVDSLIKNYCDPLSAISNDSAMLFWKNRINPSLPGITSESKYAGTLSLRFRLFGDIGDLKTADSVLHKLDNDFNHREAQANLTLVSFSILQHRFREADVYLDAAKKAGIKKYDLLTASFDVDFELGRYFNASNELTMLKSDPDFGYYFRRSKMDHLNGLLDSSIHAMQRAADLERNNVYLEQVALSNLADLYLHAGEPMAAAALYKKCLLTNGADFHSMTGLGWISLVHDQNDSLAEKVFAFVRSKNKLPDSFFRLSQLAMSRNDSLTAKKFAMSFANRASDPVYGNMYNKYLIELYTGLLHDPAKAEEISKSELSNRSTPQTYAWYAWSLFSNNKQKEGYQVFQKFVSGRPLEGLELYWMGKLMEGMQKEYDAKSFFRAAIVNKYDLSPEIMKDLHQELD
jgi:hypothetical protein